MFYLWTQEMIDAIEGSRVREVLREAVLREFESEIAGAILDDGLPPVVRAGELPDEPIIR